MWSYLRIDPRSSQVPPRDAQEARAEAADRTASPLERPARRPPRRAPRKRRSWVASRSDASALAPRPEILEDEPVRRLGRAAPTGGRREQSRARWRVAGPTRSALALETIGVFRVVSRRSLVHYCFDGHPYAANRELARLERNGLIKITTVRSGRPRRKSAKNPSGLAYGYQVYSLTGKGRDLVAARRRNAAQSVERVVSADSQRFWTGQGDPRQLRHDHQVFDAVAEETAGLEESRCHVRRVRLESELRGLLAAAGHEGRKRDGPEGELASRRKCAQDLGLRVFETGVPLPDALLEIEHPDGSITTRSLEVTTSQYSAAQVAEKRAAGFRLYGWSGRDQKRAGTVGREEFPLSWGR